MGKLISKSWVWLARPWGRQQRTKSSIGVLNFEVSGVMSQAISLWHSLADDRIAVLRDETLRLQGTRKLVSDDDDFLLSLALAETLNSLHLLWLAVSRLASRSVDPVLRRFDLVFSNFLKNDSDPFGLELNHKMVEREVKKMENIVSASGKLLHELEVLAGVENHLRRMEAIPEMSRQGCSLRAYKKRVLRQRQLVKSLQEVSVWNRSYDFVARFLARFLFTVAGRIKHVFGFQQKDVAFGPKTIGHSSSRRAVSGFIHSLVVGGIRGFASGPLMNYGAASKNHRLRRGILRRKRPLNNRTVPDSDVSTVETSSPNFQRQRSIAEVEGHDEPELQASLVKMNLSRALFESRRKLLNPSPSTLGAAALALHYANLIIVIEKLAVSPKSIGPEVRDDLYSMLPKSIREALKVRLRSYAKNLGSSVCDPTLAEEWRDAMNRILEWLSPLAYNMVKWQEDRNFEQHQHLVSSSNVLLLQTLYYADQVKAEAAIIELLVGLNYLWRFGRELKAKNAVKCVGSRGYDDCCKKKILKHAVGNLK